MSLLSIRRRLLKPWFAYDPQLVLRAAFFEFGFFVRGWTKVKTCFGATLICDTRKDIGRALFKNGVYELATSEVVWRLLKIAPRSLFVDVGGNVGYYSALARKCMGPEGSITCFEPAPDIYQRLLQNLEGLAVLSYPFAVSEKTGHATLNVPRNALSNDGLATLERCHDVIESVSVKTVSLDEAILAEVEILKLDIEGHEYQALSGARRLLRFEMIANIIFEEHDSRESRVIGMLQAFGYKIFAIGWDREGVILKPLGESSSSYLLDAPNYIATRKPDVIQEVMRSRGWHVLRGV